MIAAGFFEQVWNQMVDWVRPLGNVALFLIGLVIFGVVLAAVGGLYEWLSEKAEPVSIDRKRPLSHRFIATFGPISAATALLVLIVYVAR